MNEQILTDLQHKVESLLRRTEDATDKEYYVITELWQCLEDLKEDGNGERGMIRKALEVTRHKNLKEVYKQ
jgi:hypothetical protein